MSDPASAEREELRRSITYARDRRLHESAKWAAQQLAGLPADPSAAEPRPPPATSGETSSSAAEEDAYQLALSHFDFRASE